MGDLYLMGTSGSVGKRWKGLVFVLRKGMHGQGGVVKFLECWGG